MNTEEKLAILADAAKYDASCSSSGSSRRNSVGSKGIGFTEVPAFATAMRQTAAASRC